jgi:SAM-dependent methyltransferase
MLTRLWWNLQYILGRPRWDTGVTPPEVVELVEGGAIPPGRAIDIGCGTGTNAVYLARHGFDVVGTDIAWLAIRKARRRAREAGLAVAFHRVEATKLGTPDGPPLGEPFDLALDIGCLHTLLSAERVAYAAMLRRLVRPGGHYLLYAWGPRKMFGREVGLSPDETHALLAGDFESRWVRAGEEAGSPSYWYHYERVARL